MRFFVCIPFSNNRFSINHRPKIFSFEFWKKSVLEKHTENLYSSISSFKRCSIPRSRSVDHDYTDPNYANYNVSTIWKWFCDVARRSGAAHRLIGIKRDNNVWLTCNWTTLDNPIGLYTNWTIPNGWLFNRRVYIVAVSFQRPEFVARFSDPLASSPRNCLIRSAGQKIRMGSSTIPVYIYVTVQIVDVDVIENMKLPPSYRDFTRNREWSPRMKNKIVSLNTIATRTRLNRSIFKADSLESNHLLFFSLKYQAYYYFLFIWNKKKGYYFPYINFNERVISLVENSPESNFTRGFTKVQWQRVWNPRLDCNFDWSVRARMSIESSGSNDAHLYLYLRASRCTYASTHHYAGCALSSNRIL